MPDFFFVVQVESAEGKGIFEFDDEHLLVEFIRILPKGTVYKVARVKHVDDTGVL